MRATRSSSETIVRWAARLHRRDRRAVGRDHRHGHGAKPVRKLLVVDRDARRADALELGEQGSPRGEGVRAAAGERDALQHLVPLGAGEECEQHLAQRGAVRGEPGADVEVEVDRVLVAAGRAMAVDVDDVDVVEDRHVDGVPGLVAQTRSGAASRRVGAPSS